MRGRVALRHREERRDHRERIDDKKNRREDEDQLHQNPPPVKIAGGILIGLNALDMVQARRSQQRETPAEKAEGIQKEDIGIMPLGVPMLAGPGAISTVMVLALGSKGPLLTAAVYVSIILTAVISFFVLAAASLVERRLGQTGMRILTRLMGLVLCTIAVQFIIDGIKLSGLVKG